MQLTFIEDQVDIFKRITIPKQNVRISIRTDSADSIGRVWIKHIRPLQYDTGIASRHLECMRRRVTDHVSPAGNIFLHPWSECRSKHIRASDHEDIML